LCFLSYLFYPGSSLPSSNIPPHPLALAPLKISPGFRFVHGSGFQPNLTHCPPMDLPPLFVYFPHRLVSLLKRFFFGRSVFLLFATTVTQFLASLLSGLCIRFFYWKSKGYVAEVMSFFFGCVCFFFVLGDFFILHFAPPPGAVLLFCGSYSILPCFRKKLCFLRFLEHSCLIWDMSASLSPVLRSPQASADSFPHLFPCHTFNNPSGRCLVQ